MDKRIAKTLQNIKEAYMQLALKKETTKLTVSDVAEKAGINRSTFYLHYEDIVSIAEDIYIEVSDAISLCLDKFDITDIYGSVYGMFSYLTTLLDSNPILKNYITSSTDATTLTEKLKITITEKAVVAINESFPEIQINEIALPMTYAAAGVVDCYINWSKNRCGTQTLEELIKTICKITSGILEGITNRKL